MTHTQLHWERVLQQAGHRVTRQREIILDAICAGGGHLAVDEVLAAVRRRDRTVDRSTVYRALRLFVAVGLVAEARTPGTETRYEIRTPQPHHHLVCHVCGQEREVSSEAIQALIEAVLRDHGFQVTSDHLVLDGVCGRCATVLREASVSPSST